MSKSMFAFASERNNQGQIPYGVEDVTKRSERRVKILLVEPPKSPISIAGEEVFCYEPLALEYLAAGVRGSHDVKILDLRLGGNLTTTLDEFQPDIVGITGFTIHVNVVRRLFDEVKQWNPRTLTVVGGHHATVVPEDFLRPSIDVIVIGEGVFTFKAVVERFERGQTFESVPGIALKSGNGIVKTGSALQPELDAYPIPDRGLTAKYRMHYYSEWMRPLASIRTSKGCPFRCTFCALWKLTGGRYWKRQPEKIVEELNTMDEENVFFADDESLVDAPRMSELARLIKELGLKKRFFLYGRSDTVARNPRLLEQWREIGLERVFVGLEFCRDEDLAYINKGSKEKDNAEAVRIMNDLGIDIYASFIVRPEFGKEEFAALGSYCRKLGIQFSSFSVLTPLPGTDFYEEVKERLITHNYDYFDFIHTLLPTTLPLKEFYERYVWLYNGAIPFGKRFGILWKFPVKEMLPTVSKSLRLFKRMRMAYEDYE